eukprot:COSAG06_NODE_18707_length_872_cov_1.200517_1_plen_237_part_10
MAHSEELVWSIFAQLKTLDAVLRASAVCRDWRRISGDDRIWGPLCKEFKAKHALVTGWEMLELLKALPESRLTWRQIFMQRARSVAPLTKKAPAKTVRREQFLLGTEVYALGPRTRVLGDVQDDAAVLGALREVIGGPARQIYAPSSSYSEADAAIIKLERTLMHKVSHFRGAFPHVAELFGPSIASRAEWIWERGIEMVDELYHDDGSISTESLSAYLEVELDDEGRTDFQFFTLA